MEPHTAYIALGSNLGDRAANLQAAIARLAETPGVEVVRVSSFLDNPAVGGPDANPPFLNAAAELSTIFTGPSLLRRLLEIERSLGRVRTEKWGPRTIDLDLLLFGDSIIDQPDLKVPHPLMHERDFVLKPLAEIAPDVVHPILKKTVGELLRPGTTGPVHTPGANKEKVSPNDPSAHHVEHGQDARATALHLRPATNADCDAVKNLVFAILHEYGLKPDPCCTDLDLTDIEGHYFAKGGRFDVLVNEAGVVYGSVGLSPLGDGATELRKMYLHRSTRGQGWGKRLLDHALAEARKMGTRRLILETATVLKEAVALYEKYGFKPFAMDPMHKTARCDVAYEYRLTY